MNVDLTSIERSVLFKKEEGVPGELEGRKIARFVYNGLENQYTRAATLIQEFVNANGLTLLTEDLATVLSKKPYLVVNESCALLSGEKGASAETLLQYVDIFFSGALLRDPISCFADGYSFEREHLEAYMAANGGVCPAGGHILGEQGVTLPTNHWLQRTITAAIQQEEERATLVEGMSRCGEKVSELTASNTLLQQKVEGSEQQLQAQQKTIRSLEVSLLITNATSIPVLSPNRHWELNALTLLADGAVLLGTKEDLIVALLKTFHISTSRPSYLHANQAAPITFASVSAVVNFFNALIRFRTYRKDGDKAELVKLSIEIASGAIKLGLSPQYQALAIGLNLLVLAHDLMGEEKMKVEDAYTLLNLAPNNRHTSEEIEEAHEAAKKTIAVINKDFSEKMLKKAYRSLNLAKSALLETRVVES